MITLRMRHSACIFLCGICLLVTACGVQKQELTVQSPDGKSVRVQVEVADSRAERERGLMFRTDIGLNEGMLFIFPQEQELAFWMKDTPLPLDIMFFDQDGHYVSSATMEPCEPTRCRVYRSARIAKYALEVPAGFIRQHGVEDGWQFGIE